MGREMVDFYGVNMTAKRANFARLRIDGVPATLAADLCGYVRPDSAGSALDKDPKLSEAINRALSQRIVVDVAPKAYKRLLSLIESDKTPPGIALKASQWALEVAGVRPAPSDNSDGINGESLDNMTLGQLEAVAARARDRLKTIPALEGEARTVNGQARQVEGQETAGSDHEPSPETLLE